MKTTLIFVLVCFAAVYALPQGTPAEIVLLESDIGENNYNFKFETSDGSARQEEGTIRETGDPEDPSELSVKGSYAFVDDKGDQHKVSYVADKDGYRVLPGSN